MTAWISLAEASPHGADCGCYALAFLRGFATAMLHVSDQEYQSPICRPCSEILVEQCKQIGIDSVKVDEAARYAYATAAGEKLS